MEDRFVPGIYNYCDRWCERCAMTAHCRVFVDEQNMTDEQKDVNSEAFWEHLNDNLEQAMELIREHMEELGLDWETIQEDAKKNLETDFPPPLSPEQKNAENLARHYYKAAEHWFKTRKHLFEEKEDSFLRQLSLGMQVMPEATRLSDALEVINWYSFFIGAKLGRALNGLNDEEMIREFPLQNDANGSAKITLISIERSLAAWEVVRSYFPEVSDELLDIQVLLGRLRREVRLLFPKAEAFIRPGFDEPELSIS